MRRLLATFAACVLMGCNPQLRGECKAQSDCPSSLACVSGVCVSPSFVPGQVATCSPACGSGEICRNGACAAAAGVSIRVTSPAEGASLSGLPLKVTIEATAPDTISAVEARLLARGQTVLQVRADAVTGGFEATLDLSLSTITDGSYELIARMYRGEQRDDSTPVHLLIDKTGPVIAMIPVQYPARPEGSPATGAFLRDEQVVLDANISDPLTGLSTDPPVLLALGMDPVVGVPQQGHIIRFSFSARTPIFRAIKGLVNVKILASDVVGNTATVSTSVQLSRHRWTWAKGGSKGTSTAPAVVGDLLVIGGDDTSLHGIRRSTGAHAWDLTNLVGAPVGHIAAGQSRVYAALADGHVIGVDPRDTAIPGSQRVQFTCPSYQPGLFQPPLRRQVSGVAIGSTPISSMDMTTEETLFTYSADGYVQMFRKSEVPNGYGQGNGCMVETSTTAMNDSSTPSIVSQNGSLSIFVGDAQGEVHNVGLSFAMQPGQFQPTFSLNAKWGFNTGAIVASSVAIGMPKDVLGLLIGSGSGLVQALDTSNGRLWTTSSPVPMTMGIRATPVMAGASAYLHDQSGGVQKISLEDGAFEWALAATGPSRSPKANASPVVAQDGSFFATGGPQALSIDSSGRTLWTFDARSTPETSQTQLVDAVAPALACDGTLYVVATDGDHAYVHALITDSIGGLATSGWPAGFHDSRNTGNANQPLVGASGACAD